MKDFRAILAAGFMALWAFMIIENPHEPLIVGAMIANVAAIAGYYYGSTKSSGETAAKNADAVSQALVNQSSQPQPVVVANDATNPVPVEPKETL